MSLTVVKVLDEPLVFIAPHRPISEGELRGGDQKTEQGLAVIKRQTTGERFNCWKFYALFNLKYVLLNSHLKGNTNGAVFLWRA